MTFIQAFLTSILTLPMLIFGLVSPQQEPQDFGSLRAIRESQGGTGTSTYVGGDILYADGDDTLGSLPVGTNGQVLKVSGGFPSWGADNTGSGSGSPGSWELYQSNFLTPTNTALGIYVNGTSTLSTTTISVVNGTVTVDGNRFTKNSAGVQAAVDLCKATPTSCGAVDFGHGEIDVDSRIYFSDVSNITFFGHGNNTVFKASQSLDSTFQDHYRGMLFLDGHTATTSNVVFRDFVIDANLQEDTPAMTIGGGSSIAGLKNIFIENVVMKNATGTSLSGILNIFPGHWTNLYSDPHGYIDGLTLKNVEVASSTAHGISILGSNMSNFTLRDSYIHDNEDNGVSYSEISPDGGSDLGGQDGGEFKNFKFIKNRFENNCKVSVTTSRGHVFGGVNAGVKSVTFEGNYFGPQNAGCRDGSVSTGRGDFYSILLYNSIGTKIVNNFFDGETATTTPSGLKEMNAISLGASSAANYYRHDPMQYTEISGNIFYKLAGTYDHDTSFGEIVSNNVFIETSKAAYDQYSRHYPTKFFNNLIINPNSDGPDGSGVNKYSAIQVNADEGVEVYNNTIIDNRLLRNPDTAPTLSQSSGGSLGARTYYVRYSWSNDTGETEASPRASYSVSANNLLTVTIPSSITIGVSNGPGPAIGTKNVNIYVSETSGLETLQHTFALQTKDFTWTEPTTGLVSGASVPTENTTQALTRHAIYESNSNGDAPIPNIYKNNVITGVTSTPIVIDSKSVTVSMGNIFNLNSASTTDTINYQILPTIASSTQSVVTTQASSTRSIIEVTNHGSGQSLLFADSINGNQIVPASSTLSLLQMGSNPLSGSSNGTYIGANPSSFSGNFIDLQVNDTSVFQVNNLGGIFTTGSTTIADNLSVNGNFKVDGNATTTGNFVVGTTNFKSPTNTLSVVGNGYIEGDLRVVGTLDSSDIRFDNGFVLTEGDKVGLPRDNLVLLDENKNKLLVVGKEFIEFNGVKVSKEEWANRSSTTPFSNKVYLLGLLGLLGLIPRKSKTN